jgi:hypothetical protein
MGIIVFFGEESEDRLGASSLAALDRLSLSTPSANGPIRHVPIGPGKDGAARDAHGQVQTLPATVQFSPLQQVVAR